MGKLGMKQEVKALLPNSATFTHLLTSNLMVLDIEGEHNLSSKIYYGRHKRLKFIILEQLRF